MPNVHAIGSSLHTLLAPLNNQLFSTTTIRIFTTFTSILAIFSLIAVLTGWRKAPSQLKRLWVFMATFSLASIMPVAWNLFTVGISNNLLMSHFYYFSLAGLLPMMTIALFEFHDNSRAYVLTITLTFVVLISSNIYVLNVNNRPWKSQPQSAGPFRNKLLICSRSRRTIPGFITRVFRHGLAFGVLN